jgi:hypothetical protein
MSLVSKVFERCIYNIIIDHLSSQLYDLQYGFRSGKSTTAQMLYVLHKIHNVLEKRGQSILISRKLSIKSAIISYS